MSQTSRSINQQYWRFESLPHIELRRTEFSTQHYKPHSHKQLSIGAILEGCTYVNYQGREQLAQAGDLVIINPNKVHYCNPSSGHFRSYYMLYLDAGWCQEKLSALYSQVVPSGEFDLQQIHCSQMTLQDPVLFKQYIQVINYFIENELSQADLMLDQLMLQLFSQHFSPIVHIASGIQAPSEHKFTQYCRQSLLADMALPPGLDQIAQELDCRTETLIRYFKRDMGISPKAFLNNARIEQAKILLKGGSNLSDAALEVGFSDQSHFHKAFVNYTSATPRQYQKSE